MLFWLSLLLLIRKALVRLFDKLAKGTMTEGINLSNKIIDLHKRRCVIQEALMYMLSNFISVRYVYVYGSFS